MPLVSKYTPEQVDKLVAELLLILERDNTPLDLSLIAVGNLASHLLLSRLAPGQRQAIAESFGSALLQSVKTETH